MSFFFFLLMWVEEEAIIIDIRIIGVPRYYKGVKEYRENTQNRIYIEYTSKVVDLLLYNVSNEFIAS